MAQEQNSEVPKRAQYPVDARSYRIVDEIGVGVSAIVYKALCLPMNSDVVAIKAIDLDKSKIDLDNVRRETKILSLLSHPNILNAHCSFIVDRRLWVVMPFMSAGSLQSIISSSFPDGLSEPCIAVVLKETLNALSYLHNQGHLHRDIKAGNILIDSDGRVKLADFGVSASIYESVTGLAASSSGSRMMLTDVAGTPYWMAPEVIHSHTGYSLKADIWSFGITALELSHGRPPLSHLPPSKSLFMKITKRFRFSDIYEKNIDTNCERKFTKAFKDMVASCLDPDPTKRPSADKLLKHSFFKNCKGSDFLVKNVLNGLSNIEERFKEAKVLHGLSDDNADEGSEDDVALTGTASKTRRISGWNFNEDGFELEPVFPTESTDDSAGKQVRFGGETIIRDRKPESSESGDSGESSLCSPAQTTEEMGAPSESENEVIDRDTMLDGLMALKRNLDEQRQTVINLIAQFGGEEQTREEQLMQAIERMKLELENEKQKNFELEMELGFLKLLASGADNSGGGENGKRAPSK